MRHSRATLKGVALNLVLVTAAVLVGLALRTPTPAPADYCTSGNHVTINDSGARTVLGAPECKESK